MLWCKTLSLRGSHYKHYRLVGCDATDFGSNLGTFLRYILHRSSGWKTSPLGVTFQKTTIFILHNSLIRNWWPTRCKFWFIYFYPISSTCFWRCFRPSSGALDSIYSFWYSPTMLLPADVMDEMEREFHLVHDTGRQQHSWTISEAVNTVTCSWWWAKTSPETYRTDWVQIKKPKICISLVIIYELY